MSKTKQAEAMDRIEKPIHMFLKSIGFKKRRRTFNRPQSDGLIQVINLQMGPHEPSMFTEIPPIRMNLYGMFTVNLGVFIPIIAQEMSGKREFAFVNEYNCGIRARFSNLLKTDQDIWWNLDADSEAVSGRIIQLLAEPGLPFLDKFKTNEDIIGNWPSINKQYKLSLRPYLDIALILTAMGRKEEATEAVRKHLAKETNAGHLDYVKEMATKYGWKIG